MFNLQLFADDDVVTDNVAEEIITPDDVTPEVEVPKLFDQAHVDSIIEGRIARAERRFNDRLVEVAGVDLTQDEPVDAVRLWGFLKTNPQLSQEVQNIIDSFVQSGQAKTAPPMDTRDRELAKREAIFDLREKDTGFAKNSKGVLEWAEDNGFRVTDAKTLNVAYLAWKGANATQQLAQAQLEGQRKAQQKTQDKKQAGLERGKGGTAGKYVDYTKLSVKEILAIEGLSLITDEE